MKVNDYIAERLYQEGIRHVFGIMGGGAAGINDGFIRSKIEYICFHHEQGASNAALAYSKSKNQISVVNPTTGCGGLNCVTSLVSAFQDSVPLLFISGNYRLQETTRYLNKTKNISLRKFGLQEHDIIEHVKYATKFFAFIEDKNDVPMVLEKAIQKCVYDRPGPCWIDIPSDIQTQEIDNSFLFPNIETEEKISNKTYIEEFFSFLNNSKRPLILLGSGVNISDCKQEVIDFIELNQIPTVSTFSAKNILPFDHKLSIGTIGIKGSRAGNFALQNCDLLIALGCSLNSSHTGYDKKLFSPKSKKILVNIDENDYLKNNVDIDLFIKKDLKGFLNDIKN
jgi:acetolactate synthase-1/2/3 large subunit